MTITRRVFVKSGGLALFSLGFDPLFLGRAAYSAIRPTVRPSDRPTLVCLFQRGAVDGLNMIVPHGEELYYRERPRIAVPRGQVVDLDGHFGLHPALAALKPLWDNKSLAAVHAVGSPDSTRDLALELGSLVDETDEEVETAVFALDNPMPPSESENG